MYAIYVKGSNVPKGGEEISPGEYYFRQQILSKGHIRWGGYTFNSLRRKIADIGGFFKPIYVPDKIRDVAMWVGGTYYPEVEDFVRESKKLGSCKRIANLPKDIVPGKSRVWLIHESGYQVAEGEDKRKIENFGKIFGFFYINRFEAIINREEDKKELNNLIDVKYIFKEEIKKEHIRGCGYRYSGAYYMVGDPNFEKNFQIAKAYTNKFSITGDLILLTDPIPYEGKRFRGAKYIDDIHELDDLRIIEKLIEDITPYYKTA